MGNPQTVNSGPAGVARFCTLRSWLSQWSAVDTRADAVACVPFVSVPLLVIENGADDAVPPSHPQEVFAAAVTADKSWQRIENATHYYRGQPEELAQGVAAISSWIEARPGFGKPRDR